MKHIQESIIGRRGQGRKEFESGDIVEMKGSDYNKYLYLGPFQGEVACSIIPFDKGVCGASYSQKKTIIVSDVNAFKGHIACSSKSKSEIVVPIIKSQDVIGVIDIDSPIYSRFSNLEKEFLEKVAELIASSCV